MGFVLEKQHTNLKIIKNPRTILKTMQEMSLFFSYKIGIKHLMPLMNPTESLLI